MVATALASVSTPCSSAALPSTPNLSSLCANRCCMSELGVTLDERATARGAEEKARCIVAIEYKNEWDLEVNAGDLERCIWCVRRRLMERWWTLRRHSRTKLISRTFRRSCTVHYREVLAYTSISIMTLSRQTLIVASRYTVLCRTSALYSVAGNVTHDLDLSNAVHRLSGTNRFA